MASLMLQHPEMDASDGHADPASGVPGCYTSLALFANWFSGGGLPVLMYHKLGRCPPRTRLRGLYVDPALFHRQLAELADAGFRSVEPGGGPGVAGNLGHQVVLTFDDGFENVLRLGLEPLRAHGMLAIQYLVPGLLGRSNEWEQREGEVSERLMDAVQVREWLAAGHGIGAHTCTHPRLTEIPLNEAREEIRASKTMLEDQFNVPVRHFCYPYGDWNPAVRDAVAEAGYETACTTAPGLNCSGGDPFRLRRLTARRTPVQWRTLGTCLRLWLSARGQKTR